MKSELRLANHSVLPGAKVVEIWYAGEFIGQVVGADGPGVRIITKHRMITEPRVEDGSPQVTDVTIVP